MTDATEDQDIPHKPRVALMGEFSAGKSTLTNLLLGAAPLPVKITATRLPPVWITQGDDGGLREDTNGDLHPITAADLDNVRMEDTRLIQLCMQADILRFCDLVDMPGISDPNMSSRVWSEVIAQADILIWCTHATQAWRQSEAAAWESLPDHLKQNAILLVTRFDKLTSQRDRDRVLARLRAEAGANFRAIFPVSLLDAVSAGDDRDRWERSGAEPFVRYLVDLLLHPEKQARPISQPAPDATAPREVPVATGDDAAQGGAVRVLPTRVRPVAGSARGRRPGAAAAANG
jgi:GTP-binding protein EngB required for normal cell division